MPDFVKLEEINLKSSSELNEKWIQNVIADNPEILGLGNLVLKDKERIQPHAGRLDLLLQSDDEESTRYEVEIQLGKTDESHIIRTIEYWDIERNRYPNYDHIAVIIAEDITSRFLNVISLFNKSIPIIALQMKALKVDKGVSLVFTKVLDLIPAGIEDEEEDSKEVTDRNYWEKRSSKEMLSITDKMFSYVEEIAPGYELNYNKYYIGLMKDGISNNFVFFKPRKQWVAFFIKLLRTDDIDNQFEEKSFEWKYDTRNQRYVSHFTKDEIESNKELIQTFAKMAFER